MKTILALFLAVLAHCSFAQTAAFPNRPVRLVIGFPAGGGADVVARAVTAKMDAFLGQPIVVENRAGATGNIGAELVAKSAPDGYTMYLASASTGISAAAAANGTLKIPFDFMKDFAPVVLLVYNQIVLAAHPSVPVSNVTELIALARSKPGSLNFGSYGTGSSSHLAGELFRQVANVDITHVPYKGAAPATADLVGGQIQLGFLDVAVVLQHIKSGKLKAIALGSTRRFEGLPNVPTFQESGLPAYESSGWLGLMVPVATPADAIARLRDAALKALAMSDLRERLTSLGVAPAGGTSAEFASFMNGEVEKWKRVLRVGGITPG